MSARPVGDGDGQDGLWDGTDAEAAGLYALAHGDHPLPGWSIACHACNEPPAEAFRRGYRAGLEQAEQRARERAAEELRAAAAIVRDDHGTASIPAKLIDARADALAADDRTEPGPPLADLGDVARRAVDDASPKGPLTGGLITPENPAGGLRPPDDRTGQR